MVHHTRQSGLRMAAGMRHVVDGPENTDLDIWSSEDVCRLTIATRAAPGREAAHRQVPRPTAGRASAPVRRCTTRWWRRWPAARLTGWDGLLAEQRAYLDEFWARRRRRGGGRRRGAAGGALRPVPHPAGRRPGRAAPDPRQGPDRPGLRRPHVLGHRDVRAAGAHLHHARRRRPTPLRVAQADHADRRGAGPGAGPRGRGVPVAHDPGPRVVGLLAGRHRRLPHQRRHRRRRRPLPRRHPGRAVRAGGRPSTCWSSTARLWRSLGHHDRDGPVPHRRRDRARRVHAPSSTTTCTRTSWRSRTCGPPPTSCARHPDRRRRAGRRRPRRWRRGATRPTPWSIPYDDDAGRPPAERGLHRPRACGTSRQHAAGRVPAAAALPVLRPVPQAGGEAGRPGAGACSCGATRSPTSRRTATSRYYEAHHRARLVAVGVHPGGGGRRARATWSWRYDYLAEAALDGPARTCSHNTRDGLHMASLAGAWTALVEGFGGMRARTAACGSRPGCRAASAGWRSASATGAAASRSRPTATTATYRLWDGPADHDPHQGEEVDARRPRPVEHGRIDPAAAAAPAAQPPGREPQRRGQQA